MVRFDGSSDIDGGAKSEYEVDVSISFISDYYDYIKVVVMI